MSATLQYIKSSHPILSILLLPLLLLTNRTIYMALYNQRSNNCSSDRHTSYKALRISAVTNRHTSYKALRISAVTNQSIKHVDRHAHYKRCKHGRLLPFTTNWPKRLLSLDQTAQKPTTIYSIPDSDLNVRLNRQDDADTCKLTELINTNG